MAPLRERVTNSFRFNSRSYYGEILQLQSALNDDYNVSGKKTRTTFQSQYLEDSFFQNLYQFVHITAVSLIFYPLRNIILKAHVTHHSLRAYVFAMSVSHAVF